MTCDLSILIVSWNTRDLLQECLGSVQAELERFPGLTSEVIVVDNASADGSFEMVSRKFPWVVAIKNNDNVGFAQASIQGYQASHGQKILLLNPDTWVKPAALNTLVEFMDSHPKAGAVGARLLNPDGSLQQSCYPLPSLGREFWRLFHLDALYAFGRYAMERWDTQTPREIGLATGACLLLRRAALDEVGFLDPDYFMYMEEADLCYRLHRRGWLMFYQPQAVVVHFQGQSTRQAALKMFLLLYQTKILFFRKHTSRLAVALYKWIIFAAALGRLAGLAFNPFLKPSQRKAGRELALNYWALIKTLPSM
jgi:GT2 family glycosyltransferase